MKSSEPQAGGTIQSDRTLLAILEGLQEAERAGVTELSERLDLSKSTVHKHLKTLHEYGYVRNDDGTYRLSFRFLTLGGVVRNSRPLCNVAYDPMRELAEETDTITTFAIYEGDKGYFTHHFNNKYDLSVVNIGSEFHLHQNAAGKAMLAELPDAEIESVIERTDLPASTNNTIVAADELFEEIAQIRDQGYAISLAERVVGVQSIAVAVEDAENGELGAVSISTPAAKSSRSQIEEKYADVVTNTAVEIELKLRYH